GISFFDPESKTLKFVTQQDPNPSVWSGQTVDPDQDVGDFNALAFTPLSTYPSSIPAGQPAIVYHDRAHDRIKYAIFDGTTWKRETVQSQFGVGFCSLAFEPPGWPRIGYSFRVVQDVNPYESVVFRAWDPQNQWNFGLGVEKGETGSVACFPGPPTSSSGIAFTMGGGELRYFHLWGGDFQVERPGKTPTGEWIGPFAMPSLAFSPSGQPAISYYDISNSTIKYAAGTLIRTRLDFWPPFVNDLLFRMRSARAIRNLPKR